MSLISLAERFEHDASPGAVAPLRTQFPAVLVAAQAGAEWAWTLLYRAVAPALLAYLRAGGASDPDDALGDVFLQLARNLGTFAGDEAGFRSWAFVVAHHRILDDRRRRRRKPAVPVAEVPDRAGGSTEDEALGGVLSAEVRTALGRLTPEQRDVVLLRVFADMSTEEVAKAVGRPVSSVKALQRRAYAQLRKQISPDPYLDSSRRR